MLFSDIPTEIFLRILADVPKNDQFECMNVSRLWREKTIPLYYNQVSLYNFHANFIHYAQTTTTPYRVPICQFVHTLNFGYLNYTHNHLLSKEQFLKLIFGLPHLTTIYFEYLEYIDYLIEYLKYLEEIGSKTKIQEVTIRKERRYNSKVLTIHQRHYNANKQLRHQITSLVLHELIVDGLMGAGEALDYLSGFPRLERLYFANRDNIQGHQREVHVTSVLEACPHLKSLEMISHYAWIPKGRANSHVNLTRLTFNIPEFHTQHADYLIDYAPNLKYLDLDIQLTDGAFSNAVTSRGIQYFSQLRHLQVKSTVGSHDNSDRFWKMMCAFYDGTSLCKFSIRFSKSYSHQKENFCFDRATRRFDITYDWILDEFSHIILPFKMFRFESIQLEDLDGCCSSMDHWLEHALVHKNTELKLLFYKKPRKTFFASVKEKKIEMRGLLLSDTFRRRIESYYPSITRLELSNCVIQKEDKLTNHYVLDLCRFDQLCELEFDLYAIFGNRRRRRGTFIHFVPDNGKETYYCQYKESVLRAIEAPKDIPKSMYVIKIKSCKPLQFKFHIHIMPELKKLH